MLATLNLDKRKQQVLDAIVRDHLYSAEPVGSLTVWENYIHTFSPATIRHEMAELEGAGYIEQPHTSSGRIPTDRGYRYYVDHLMKEREVTPKEEEYIKKSLSPTVLEVEEALHQTARILSHTLEYATIAVNIGSHHRIFSAGFASLLHQPEFRRLEQAQQVLDLLEKEELITEMIEEYAGTNEVTIKIGRENKYSQMKDYSVMVASYEFGKERGGLGIIGPTRMFYNKALRVIKFVVRELRKIGSR